LYREEKTQEHEKERKENEDKEKGGDTKKRKEEEVIGTTRKIRGEGALPRTEWICKMTWMVR